MTSFLYLVGTTRSENFALNSYRPLSGKIKVLYLNYLKATVLRTFFFISET